MDFENCVDIICKEIDKNLANHLVLWSHVIPDELDFKEVTRVVNDVLRLKLETTETPLRRVDNLLIVDFTNFHPTISSLVHKIFLQIVSERKNLTFKVPTHLDRDECCIQLEQMLDDFKILVVISGQADTVIVTVERKSEENENGNLAPEITDWEERN